MWRIIHFVTSCLRYLCGKYYPNWSGFNGVIDEVKGVVFGTTVYSVNKTNWVANESKYKWNGADKMNSIADLGKAARGNNNNNNNNDK